MTTSSRLTITTPSDRELQMTRVFDAPRRLVFQAYTSPELLKRWLGVFGGWTLAVCEIDLRVGGASRYVWRHTNGKDMTMRGVFREIVPDVRLVSTESFDDPWYEGQAIATTTFEEEGGRTTLRTTMLYASREVRDAVVQSPMEQGVAASYDQLAEVLAAEQRAVRLP